MNITYQQKYILYGLGLVVLIFLWYVSFYKIQNRKIGEMKIEITKINSDLSKAQSASEGIKTLQDDIEKIKNDIENMKEKIPSKDRLLYISQFIQSKGEQYGLKIEKISPQKEILFSEQTPSSSIIKIPINIWMIGKYFELGKFIESFNDFPFLLKAGSVTISGDDDNYPELQIYLIIYVYLYK